MNQSNPQNQIAGEDEHTAQEERQRRALPPLPPEIEQVTEFITQLFSETTHAKHEYARSFFLAELAYRIAEPRLKPETSFRPTPAGPTIPGNAATLERNRAAVLEQSVREARFLLELCEEYEDDDSDGTVVE